MSPFFAARRVTYYIYIYIYIILLHVSSYFYICAFILLYICPDTTLLGEGNMVTVDARVVAQTLQREQQLVGVLAEHVHAEGEHSTGYAGDDY
jgi:hypothetical protein